MNFQLVPKSLTLDDLADTDCIAEKLHRLELTAKI